MAHPELPAEQAYIDRAYDCFDRMRAALLRTGDAGATEVAAEAIEAWATRRLQTFDDAERGLCFGRIDVEGANDPLYVGRRWCTTTPRTFSWSTGRRRPHGRSTRPRRRRRTG
jgi:hypothetical protein